MTLDEYFNLPLAMSYKDMREAIGAKSDSQVRQWRYGYANRIPGPLYASAIERVTGWAVMRWDLRPHDWHLIWPELVDMTGAPEIAEAVV